MTFIPPSPVIISGGGGSGGSSISNNGSEVAIVTDQYGESGLIFETDQEQAMIIDSNQNITMGVSQMAPTTKLLISDSMGKCLSLFNSMSQLYANFQIDNNGLSISTTNNLVRFGSNKIYAQNGNFYLSDVAVVSTANQLNYNNVTPGIAYESKSLVVDDSKNITGINSLESEYLIGTLLTANQPNINSLHTVNITTGLSIGGSPVRSSANEINYLYGTTPGTITSNKAFVFDSAKNLIGVNRLTANSIAGTLEDGNQEAIISVGTLTNLNTSGPIGIGTNSPSTDLEIVNDTPTIKLNNGTATSQISLLSNNLQLISSNDIVLTGNTRLQNNTLSGITSLTATSINGTLITSDQSNITNVGNLISLNVMGSTSIGDLSTSPTDYRLIIKAQNGSTLLLQRTALLKCALTISSNGDLIIAPTNITNIQSSLLINGALTGITDLTATTLTGTIQTADQPRITSVGTLTSLAVTNSIIADTISANAITGTLQTTSQPNITSIGILVSLSVTNGITASSVGANTLTGTLQTSTQDNITRTGTLTRLSTTAPLSIGVSSPTNVIDINTSSISTTLAISMTDGTNNSLLTTDAYGVTLNMSGNLFILGANKSLKLNGGTVIGLTTLTATEITGTLQTAAQPNITSVGTLGSLGVTNGIIATAVSADSLTGTLQTSAQPNITLVGTLNSLGVTNGITADSISVNALTGTLQTAIQDNITRTGILTRLLTTAPLAIGISSPVNVIDINTSSISTILAISMTDGINSSTITTNSNGITLNTSGNYITLGANKSLKLNGGDIIGLSTLTVNTISGTLTTAAQNNITSVGTLDYVDTTYIGLGDAHTTSYRINVLDSSGLFSTFSNGNRNMTISIINNDFTFNTSNQRIALHDNVDLVLNGGTIVGLNTLTANTIAGTLTTDIQTNIISVGELTSLKVIGNTEIVGLTATDQIYAPSVYINGGPLTVIGSGSVSTTFTVGTSITLGTTIITQQSYDDLVTTAYAANLQGGTFGVVVPELALIADINKDLGTFNNLRANNLYGTIKDTYQSLITTIGTLEYLNVSGDMGIGTITPEQKLEVVSITGNCLRLTNSTVSKNADLTIDDAGNLIITPSNTTKTNTMMIGNATANQIPMEVGYASFTMTSPYAYRTNTGATGIVDPVIAPTSYNYSIRALGRILCTGSIDVMSDKRVKTNIKELTDEYCTAFVKYTTPVRYNRINGDPNENFGYIAQELMRAGFPELVNLIPDDDMNEEIDEDGYISPEGMAYNISYEHIIPILAKNQQRIMKDNEELRDKIDQIMKMLNE